MNSIALMIIDLFAVGQSFASIVLMDLATKKSNAIAISDTFTYSLMIAFFIMAAVVMFHFFYLKENKKYNLDEKKKYTNFNANNNSLNLSFSVNSNGSLFNQNQNDDASTQLLLLREQYGALKSENDCLKKENEELKMMQQIEQKKFETKQKGSDEEINRLTKLVGELNKKIDSIKQQVTDQFKDKMGLLEKQNKSVSETLNSKEQLLLKTEQMLKSTSESLEKSKCEISALCAAQKNYSEYLSFVPFANESAQVIQRLLSVGSEIEKSACVLMTKEMEDGYYLLKAFAVYHKLLSSINMSQFYTDVQLAAEAKLAFVRRDLAKYSVKDAQKNTLLYFYYNYLEKYINALVVFNESLAGLKYFIKEISAADTQVFCEYRESIKKIVAELGVNVSSAKVFDTMKNRNDIQAKSVDVGAPSGVILEVENCIVSYGSQKSSEKVKVKIQA